MTVEARGEALHDRGVITSPLGWLLSHLPQVTHRPDCGYTFWGPPSVAALQYGRDRLKVPTDRMLGPTQHRLTPLEAFCDELLAELLTVDGDDDVAMVAVRLPAAP